jgi:hypothetical protein
MKEHGIQFSAPMVRAILAGIKTETRRLKPRKIEVGDVVWVRETHQPNKIGGAIYAADYTDVEIAGLKPWKPSLFMPRELSRIQKVVTGVRIERLQDITDKGAIAEGIEIFRGCREYVVPIAKGIGIAETDPLDAYARLFDSLHGPGTWESNPEVQVISWAEAA